MTPGNDDAPETWGGIECTINRLGDQHRSQLALNGHAGRIESDLDAFASLGLTAIRYPVLWEQVEQPSGHRDFDASDRALAHLHEGPMRPILGLLHHGSGPLSTSPEDPRFPARFAAFAGAVARRYPWVSDYTPINEPLTTARFSGLYGHWYPHARQDATFVRLLLGETRAIILAMRAIREVNSSARLLQTEDLGQADGTDPLTEQVDFENARRWLSFDLLCGRVGPDHPLWPYLTGRGCADPQELRWFVDNACPPDVVGLNHYPRSNRWLDDRMELFSPTHHGGNGTIGYADVAASDTSFASPAPLAGLLEQAWQRYAIPVALSEVHVPGTVGQQIAWWDHALRSAAAAAQRGVGVRAVTTWSLLGSFDWDTLCTSTGSDVAYESGAFDVSTGSRVETLLGQAVRESAGARGARSLATGMLAA